MSAYLAAQCVCVVHQRWCICPIQISCAYFFLHLSPFYPPPPSSP